jgi:hypothetical protein
MEPIKVNDCLFKKDANGIWCMEKLISVSKQIGNTVSIIPTTEKQVFICFW